MSCNISSIFGGSKGSWAHDETAIHRSIFTPSAPPRHETGKASGNEGGKCPGSNAWSCRIAEMLRWESTMCILRWCKKPCYDMRCNFRTFQMVQLMEFIPSFTYRVWYIPGVQDTVFSGPTYTADLQPPYTAKLPPSAQVLRWRYPDIANVRKTTWWNTSGTQSFPPSGGLHLFFTLKSPNRPGSHRTSSSSSDPAIEVENQWKSSLLKLQRAMVLLLAMLSVGLGSTLHDENT